MFKKGLTLLVALTALALVAGRSNAMAPTILDPGDVIIGDLEGVGDNNFNFPDALPLDFLGSDDSFASPSLIKWSYWTNDSTIRINGVDPLPSPDLNLAVDPDNTTPTIYRIDLNDFDTGNPNQDGTARTITFRNTALSPVGGPNVDPGVAGIVTTQTRMVTLFASDCTTASSRTITVYTSNNTSDSVSGTAPGLIDILDDDLSDVSNWVYATLSGTATSGTATGICVSVPLTGDNYAGWVQTNDVGAANGYITLVDQQIWRMRTSVFGTEPPAGNSPLFVIDYINNYFTPATFNLLSQGTYGGTHIVLDGQGGANAAGYRDTPGLGRDSYDFYLTPLAMLMPQWRGDVDIDFSAYSTHEDAINDMNLALRILDLDSAGIVANEDFGTICLTRFQIARGDLFALWNPNDTPVYGPALRDDLFSPASLDAVEDLNETNSTGSIDNNTNIASYKLAPGLGETGSRKTLLPFDQTISGSFNEKLYPIVWTADKLYLYEVAGRAAGGSDTDPADIVDFIGFVPTTELLLDNITLRGFAGDANTNHMYRAGSFRLPANVNNADQKMVTLFYTHNVTLSPGTDGPNRITPRITISNFGSAVGTDTDGQGDYELLSMKAFDLGNP